MKMTRRNFISASAAAMLACGASLSAHAAENTTENGLNFITDIFKDPTQPGETEGATTITAEANAEWYEKLDFSDRREFANAERGWLDNAEGRIINGDDNRSVWDLQSYGDLNRDAPDTVNPSLWRNTQLNAKAGLFEVCDGIYQVRGFDMANTTFIRTDHGWIVFDVLMCKENMKAAKELMENRFGPLDIKAVLYSHSHVDHFGGVEGVITREQVADAKLSLKKQLASGKTLVLAPAGFLKHAISENVYAGIAMARRAQFQYGTVLDKGEKGALSVGIGMGQSTGTVALIAPTYEIGEDVPKLTIDGLEIEFQLTPGTEAPAEMNAYFPKYRALWMAENCTGTLHNLYTLRGAEVRDANDWAKYIIEADQRFCDKTDVVFQSHNWPHWGEEIHDYLLNTAAIYKFIHDQTLHYMNQGYTSTEVAAMLTLPEKLEKVWYTRPYYGTLAHNAKAVYQKYLGWYDANPVNLNPLPPSDTAKKLVEYLGSTDAVLRKARKDFEKGDYQWVAQITKELVFADPSNQKARNLCADALEQLGYQAESGAWRNAYLMGAAELRKGNLSGLARTANGLGSAMKEMTVDMLLDYISILTDANAAQNDDVTLNLIVTDVNEKFYVTRKNGILLSYSGENRPDAQATVTCKRLQLLALMQGQQAGQVQVSGDATALKRLLAYASKFEKTFNVIEP
ncbi:alkyl sulfatase dimerization domain-containing protein [Faecalibacterium prausnitzii]|uniref:alkyl/aryl-sulfatase n=1 Tax=Faecalibacterium prausnitzii TaxID=853 RepID=UPI002907F99C|nr:alkyl sulfatase dimerization domain-containing protein [Faecalibacterium prausnitzii]MDU8669687.1 alkyl sulfatase dimerization domain-containing protein [Faecalibacterium prausnitzii]